MVIIIIPYYARLSTILSSTLVLLFLTKLPCRSVCPEERAGAPREDERERETNMDKFDDEEKIVHFKLQLHSAHSQQEYSLGWILRIVQVSVELFNCLS